MALKSSSPGPNTTVPPAPKQARSRKAAAPNIDAGRAGSAGGIVLEKKEVVKTKSTPTAQKAIPTQATASTDSPTKAPRRKPRKLNKDPTSTTTPPALAQPPTASEIEALKARVRGLEAKVEDLYKSGSLERPGRSPRRRGKGRKGSSAQQVPTLSSTKVNDDEENVEDIGRGDGYEGEGDGGGVEELVRLEGELESARQDLAAFRPRKSRTNAANDNDDGDDVEEIERDDTGTGTGGNGNRHVTLSGSYRIPLPASVSVDDVRQIQSGVSAAQNVARSFLEQRRAAAIHANTTPAHVAKKARPVPKSMSSSMEVVPIEEDGGKTSWSEWIGGYSVAISRAVRNIEHEAGVESQRAGGVGGASGGKKKKVEGTGKRPGVKTRISGEQVEGLMS